MIVKLYLKRSKRIVTINTLTGEIFEIRKFNPYVKCINEKQLNTLLERTENKDGRD